MSESRLSPAVDPPDPIYMVGQSVGKLSEPDRVRCIAFRRFASSGEWMYRLLGDDRDVRESDLVPIAPEPSSITNPVIELSETAIAPDESSITNPVIELFDENLLETGDGFNLYPKKKNGKEYHYWRYSFRDETGQVRHRHIGSIDRVRELQGKNRQEILSLLEEGKRCEPS